jgi:hypothetical protein
MLELFFFQGTDEFVGSNITLFQASLTHVNFEVSIILHWVVDARND